MTLVATRFEGYFIDSKTFEVFSVKRGKPYKLKESYVRDTRKANPKRYKQVGYLGVLYYIDSLPTLLLSVSMV